MATQEFGRYRLLELLGRGGMGEVWQAVDTVKDREVALKILGSWLNGDPEFAVRFRRESALAARLHSPHIVPIHDYGEIDDRLYIDMPLLGGTDLGTLLERRTLPPDRAVEVVTQVARALAVAHDAGMVHRDVKPSNIMISTAADGAHHAYLIDFGIAKALDGTRLSLSGAMVGTAAYMAPECFDGEGDARSDVYSLGCVLYEALTGEPPFTAPHALAYGRLHENQPVPRPSDVRPDVPRALDDVVARAMAKAPDDRYRSAVELAAAATAAIGNGAQHTLVGPETSTPPTHVPVPPREREPRTGHGTPRWATPALVAGGLLVLAAYFLPWTDGEASAFDRWSVTWPAVVRLLLLLGGTALYARGRHVLPALAVVAGAALNWWSTNASRIATIASIPTAAVGFWIGLLGAVALTAGVVAALRAQRKLRVSGLRRDRRAAIGAGLIVAGAAGFTLSALDGGAELLNAVFFPVPVVLVLLGLVAVRFRRNPGRRFALTVGAVAAGLLVLTQGAQLGVDGVPTSGVLMLGAQFVVLGGVVVALAGRPT